LKDIIAVNVRISLGSGLVPRKGVSSRIAAI
jgi:hypothetical protein